VQVRLTLALTALLTAAAGDKSAARSPGGQCVSLASVAPGWQSDDSNDTDEPVRVTHSHPRWPWPASFEGAKPTFLVRLNRIVEPQRVLALMQISSDDRGWRKPRWELLRKELRQQRATVHLLRRLDLQSSPAPQAAVASAASAVPSHLVDECNARKRTGVAFKEVPAELTLEAAPARFPPHSAALARHVECGFRDQTLIGAQESWYLKVVSGDLEAPGFSTGFPDLDERYFLVCEGALRTSLPEFRPGLVLSRAANTFTLPCTHHFYTRGSKSRVGARRITGVHGFRVTDASLTVVDGLSSTDSRFEVAFNARVENDLEALHVKGRVAGSLSGSVRVFGCGDGSSHTKHIEPDVCARPRPVPQGDTVVQPVAPRPRPGAVGTPYTKSEPVSRLRYFRTCGDNVCREGGYRGPFPNTPRCSGQTEGQGCTKAGATCDLGNDCNMLLVCAESDPSTMCPR
jgi:hypothetical protein